MKRFLIKRLLGIIPTFFGITLISFFVIHLAPGSPMESMDALNPKASLEAKQTLAKIYGLDKPLYEQYADWLTRFLKFDFGKSFVDGTNAIDKVGRCLPVTLCINFLTIIFIFLVSIPLGVRSAVYRGGNFDRLTTIIVFIFFAIPGFWLALLLIELFGVRLELLPVSGLMSIDFEYFTVFQKIVDISKHLFLPVIVGGLGAIAGLSRYIKQKMVEQLNEDYVRTAIAKGLPENQVIYKHALSNAMIPIITIIGLSIPALISGSVIIETIFNIPGMGRLMVNSVFARDYNVIMCGLVISAILTLLGNLIADILYAYADPRIRYD
ncbi:MAG: ABC transporter permease [Candidatus Omnitrophica bacterium]|nr:ABC transporter permease [Candidatus Omnitrophota bacterium]